jgi:putative resolvase
MAERLISIGKASKLLGVSIWTLQNWEKLGKLTSLRTKGDHRRYRLSDIQALQGIVEDEKELPIAIYVRVSSGEQKQKGDLDRQKLRLLEYCANKRYIVEAVFEEVGSGMNDGRTKLQNLFKLVNEHKISKVIIEHKDRLSRFNFKIYLKYFNSHNVLIEWVEDVLPKSYEAELVEDMLSLISSFSSRVYGRRSAENRKKRQEVVSEDK